MRVRIDAPASAVWDHLAETEWWSRTYLGGRITAALGSRLVLRRVWRANLRRLASRVLAEG